MSKVLKIALTCVGILAVVAMGLATFINFNYPKVSPAPKIVINSTPILIERGRYLANNVAVCVDCHSTRDWSYLSGPIKKGSEGKGGEIFPKEFGFPGTFYSKNITPAALAGWTDGEIYRAIVSGVNKDNNAFFPVMPYHNYGRMDKEDILAIIAYLRTLKPVENQVKQSEADFPFSIILKTLPKDPQHQTRPDTTDLVKYGQYIFNASACSECHTKQDKGEPIPGMEMAGGFEFPMTGGTLISANLTPDKETGIGNLSKEAFISKFTFYRTAEARRIPASKEGYNTIMPWTMYAGMTDHDLGAIYTYLMTLKPVKNQIVKFTPKAKI